MGICIEDKWSQKVRDINAKFTNAVHETDNRAKRVRYKINRPRSFGDIGNGLMGRIFRIAQ